MASPPAAFSLGLAASAAVDPARPAAPTLPSGSTTFGSSPAVAASIAAGAAGPKAALAIDEDAIYAAIANELKTGATSEGLWIRLFAECDGDENRTKVAYIKQRAESLISAERLRLDQIERERSAEADRLEQARRQHGGFADPELVAAVWGGNSATVLNLLKRGVVPIGTDENGRSLLELARMRNDEPMLQLLKVYTPEVLKVQFDSTSSVTANSVDDEGSGIAILVGIIFVAAACAFLLMK